MAVKNAVYKVDNGAGGFDEIMFKTKAEQVVLKNGQTLEEKLKRNELYVDFRSNTGATQNYVVLKHNLGYIPEFSAYAKAINFYDASNQLHQLPIHFSKNGSDFCNIRVTADETNFYVRMDRNDNYSNNGWFNTISVWVYYNNYSIGN